MSREPGPQPLVLVVDDHDDTRQMYVEFLQSHFLVADARDAYQALDVARARRPDVVVTDLALPGMDGYQLIGAIRADPALASVPIVCLSGFGGCDHEARARAAGCDRVLQKPCMPDALAEAITALLKDSPVRSSHR